MDFKKLNKAALTEFIESKIFRNLADLPISYHRAVAQLNNPRMLPTDILLLMAMENEQVLGYLGFVPDEIKVGEGRKERIAAISCLWVSPAARGKRIAEKMVRRGLELYDGNLLGSDYVPGIKKIYDRSEGFYEDPFALKGFRIYLRSELAYILPPKKELFAKLKPMLTIADTMVNTLLQVPAILKKNQLPEGVSIAEVDRFDQEDIKLIEAQKGNAVLGRDLKTLNWIMEYPWVIEEREKSELNKKYYFSSSEPFCCHRLVKVKNKNNELIGIMLFLHRNKHLKLSYLFYQGDINIVGKVVDFIMNDWKAHIFTSFHKDLNQYLQTTGKRGLYQKPIQRQYVIAKKYWNLITAPDTIVQGGDLDAAFT